MLDIQENKLSMYRATDLVLDNNNSIWTGFTAFADAKMDLSGKITAIQLKEQQQDAIITGISIDKKTEVVTKTLGFHTNSSTKPLVVGALQSGLRDDLYYERNDEACVEMDTYELKDDGKFGAADGCHDDFLGRAVYSILPMRCTTSAIFFASASQYTRNSGASR